MKAVHSYRTLIVDDDPAIHELFRCLLASVPDLKPATVMANSGSPFLPTATAPEHFPTFEMHSAYQGQEGLACVQKALAEGRPYTMAFVDMRMPPGWNGIETIAHIWKQCFDLQIVICTGHTDFSWHDLIRRFGHSDRLLILKKPFDITEVRQVAYSLAEKWDLAHEAQDHLERLQRLVSERTARLQEANHSLQRKILENKQAEHRLITQYAVDRALVESATLADAAAKIFQIVCETLNWNWGALWLQDPKAGVLRLAHSYQDPAGRFDAFAEASRLTPLEPGTGLPGRVLTRGEPVWLNDFYQEADCPRASAASQDGLHAAVAFPVRMGSQILGVVEFLSRELVQRDQHQLQTFSVIGSAIGQFMERKHAEEERKRMEVQLRHAQKLESIGQLAAGIAHEINTPTQYIGDNIRFLQNSFGQLNELHAQYARLLAAVRGQSATPALIADTEKVASHPDIEFLTAEIPRAIEQSLDGVERVARIVRAMKDFSHPGTGEKTPLDLNKAVETTLTVSANEWKYVARIETDFDAALPMVPCLPGELNQVFLNLVVNAAHAIAEVVQDGAKGMGVITVSTRRHDDWVEIRIRDTGPGIPEKIRDKVFDLFFTTKPVGKGTGQGLSIAHAVVVDQHGGTLRFETELGVGTVFIIRLPLKPATGSRRQLPTGEATS